MSIRAVQMVLRHSRHKGTTKLVLLVLAEAANMERGEVCHPSYEFIAAHANCTVRRAIDLVTLLEADGTIEVVRDGTPGRSRANRYSLRRWIEYQEQMQARELRDRRGNGEKISGVKCLHSLDGKGEAGSENGEERVKSGDAGLHPNRKEPDAENRGERVALAHEGTIRPLAAAARNRPENIEHRTGMGTGANVNLSEFPEAFREEWRKWDGYIDEKGIVMARATRLSQLQQCQRSGLKRAIEVMRFSIHVGAKRLLWDCKPAEVPRWLRFEEKTSNIEHRTSDIEVPGLREWLREQYPDADAGTPWSVLSLKDRRLFAQARPELRFEGLLLQKFVGARGNGEAAA